eukprot:6212320-Pleurochrysis_carterae.AAC.3
MHAIQPASHIRGTRLVAADASEVGTVSKGGEVEHWQAQVDPHSQRIGVERRDDHLTLPADLCTATKHRNQQLCMRRRRVRRRSRSVGTVIERALRRAR